MHIYEIVYSLAATRDIEALRDRVEAERGEAAAQKFIDRLVGYLDGFRQAPKRGAVRSDIRPGVRIVGWERIASIAFIVEAQRVVVLAVAYGGRDIESLLKQRLP